MTPERPTADGDGGRTWAIVAGGGTAGPIVPGLAIGRALVARGHPASSIHYVGSERGMDADMVPKAGFGLTVLPGRGFARRLSPRGMVDNAGAAWGLTRALARAVALVRRRRPAVVVAVGGYAGVPCGLAAAAARVPLVVVEQNAVPGAANRLLGRFAKASAVSFPGTDLPGAVVTGNPVRPEILAVDRSDAGRAAARAALGIPDGRKVVAVTGGSLGALRINRAVLGAAERWAGRRDLAVRHAVGARDWELVQAGQPTLPPDGEGLVYQPVRYEDRMGLLMAAADLLVCRAGGNTVAEAAVVGLPAVLVPLPNAPGDHQTANARALADAGGAVLVPDGELDADRLVTEVDRLLADDARLAAMGRAAATVGRRDAAERVAALVEEHART
ncbi:MAG: UDP-N-acetylglucosamine--N-acetylmuramyl-(pentapeptide) pyrophosphoryl-undecaprenol [Actinomycetota bacterium]|nr:UDP-N-acetylglucosamine--N-acetylmuramyl-(pentapeptide) pyrophosphoryl-undecaprenol [Actinomycetota bacterium]